MPSLPLRHHDLCFGCGQSNLFGLQVELEREPDDSVSGRFFVKQDHQGPPGLAHGGVLAAALAEAAALAAGDGSTPALPTRLEVDLRSPAPVGAFVGLRAEVERREGDRIWVRASAVAEEGDGPTLAEARAVLVRGVA